MTWRCNNLLGYYPLCDVWSVSSWNISIVLGEQLHAHQPPTLLVVSICGPPVSGSCWATRSCCRSARTTDICSGDGAICQTFNSRWPGVHACWTLCLEHSARCSLPSVNNLKPGSSGNHIRTLSSEPAFLIQTINLAVALLHRQSLIDWLIDWSVPIA